MPSRLQKLCDTVMEATWLTALVVTPLFFNVYSNRVFEPDKISLLRSLALIAIVAWVVKKLETMRLGGQGEGGERAPMFVSRLCGDNRLCCWCWPWLPPMV